VSRGGGSDAVRTVPDVTRSSVADATKYLEGAGLHVDIVNVPGTAPAGTVIATKPAPGEPVAGDGVVQLSVSAGAPATTTTTPPTTASPSPATHRPRGKHGKGD
jgi:beta-lactam-binding protein with PASTA domain